MADGSHRKCVKTETTEQPTTLGGGTPVSLPIKPLVTNVVNASLASVDKKAILVGGVNPKTGRSMCQTLECDLLTKQWTHATTGVFPRAISDAAMVACGTTYVLFGGYDDEQILGDLWVSAQKVDDSGAAHQGAWQRIKTTGPAPGVRRSHSLVAALSEDGASYRVFLFGGFDGSTRCNDLWSISISALDGKVAPSWSLVKTEGDIPPPRDAAALAFDAAQNRLFLFGGFTTTLDRELFALDLTTNRWSNIPTLVGPSRRQGCFATMQGPFLLIILGQDTKGQLSQICQLSTTDMKWSLVSFEGDEIEARSHAACCLAEGGKKVLVLGGQSKGKYLTSLLELELEKCEAVAIGKGGKK